MTTSAEANDLEVNGRANNYAPWKIPNQPQLNNPLTQRAMDDAANKAKLRPPDDKANQFTSTTVPLPQLVRQLLKNFSQQSLSALQNIGCRNEIEVQPSVNDPSLQLLLQFQRLLLVRLYSEEPSVNVTASGLLLKYMVWLCDHSSDNLEACSMFLEQQPNNNAVVSALMAVVRKSVVGKVI